MPLAKGIRNRLHIIREHRDIYYERELGKLMDGTGSVNNVTYRWNKVKEIKS